MNISRNGRAMRVLIACIAYMSLGAQAAPIVFTSPQYDTTAFAVVGGLADANSANSPPSALPLVSTATVVDTSDFATAFAIGGSGLLSASAEADSFAGAVGASAGAQAHFIGTILGGGLLNLQLGFDDLSSIIGGGTADGTLFILLTNTVGAVTTTLFNDFFTTTADIGLQYDVPMGGVSTLDLLVFSEAFTTGAGQSGQNFAQVTFGGTLGDPAAIPLPGTLLLVITGLSAMLMRRRKQ